MAKAGEKRFQDITEIATGRWRTGFKKPNKNNSKKVQYKSESQEPAPLSSKTL